MLFESPLTGSQVCERRLFGVTNMTRTRRCNNGLRYLLLLGLVLGFITQSVSSYALETPAGSAIISSPARIGGVSGYGDERDADIYPAVAYDPSSGRYLVVWMTPRNAGSSSDGFDVYGVFLNRSGQRVGSEFRISDDNTVARSSFPTVITGKSEFVVSWTTRGTSCQIVVQRVTDSSYRSDRVIVSGSGHRHSPSLAYNPARQRYMMVYVEGDDYLPPTFYGAQTADCGNNASSLSSVKAIEFYFSGDTPIAGNILAVADVNGGGFRPRLTYSGSMNQYLVVWEDRRNAGGQLYRFDVYSQRISGDLVIQESDLPLATGGDYTNYDTTATWTPRPAVSEGDGRFLAIWFTRTTQGSAVIWSVMGNFIPASGSPSATPFTIARMSFAQSHAGNSPAGFLGIAYSWGSKEYLVGISSYLESVWGYLSFALIQRVNNNGQLLKMDGSLQSQPGVGYSVDYENEDQLAPGIAVNPISNPSTTDFIIMYGKHLVNQTAQDTDIWSVIVKEEAPYIKNVFLPLIMKR